MVQKPDMGAVKIVEELAQLRKPIILTRQYVSILMKKIQKERVYRANFYVQKEMLAKYEDRLKEADSYLWKILNNTSASNNSKLGAVRELRENYKALIDKIETAGIFETKNPGVDVNVNVNISKLPTVVLLGMLEKIRLEKKLRLQENAINTGAEKRNITIGAG
jgi:hypothetical protein